mmetsp:Transcript_20250/g.40176  ORF Transcript_20250/g.40176 Transcript_20250/m.40176 type:complete len:248 (-) Transcript_20250:513-1256(-)
MIWMAFANLPKDEISAAISTRCSRELSPPRPSAPRRTCRAVASPREPTLPCRRQTLHCTQSMMRRRSRVRRRACHKLPPPELAACARRRDSATRTPGLFSSGLMSTSETRPRTPSSSPSLSSPKSQASRRSVASRTAHKQSMYPKYKCSSAQGFSPVRPSRRSYSAWASSGSPVTGCFASSVSMPCTMWAEMLEWSPLTALLKSRFQRSPSQFPEKSTFGKEICSWMKRHTVLPSYPVYFSRFSNKS